MRPLSDKVYVRRFRSAKQYEGIDLPDKYIRYNCTGVIEKMSSKGDLAREGFSQGQLVIFHQQYRGNPIDPQDPDLIIMQDSAILGKYFNTEQGVVVRPRKHYVFGELIQEEKVGLIYLPNGTKLKHKNNYLKIISIPLINKFQNELLENDLVLLPKGWNVNNLTSKITFKGIDYLFANIALITNKIVGKKWA